MYVGSLPPASIHGSWRENIEITSADDGDLVDLSELLEITVKLRDPVTRLDELILTMTGGDITLPSLGIIEWNLEPGFMATLRPKLYEAILLMDDGVTLVVMILGPISVVE